MPFLLVHGLASNARTWDGVAGRLYEHGHPVTSVDLRGHGMSAKPDDGYDFATLANDLLAVLDDLRWANAVVAGQSTGGNLAIELASRAPTRVARAVASGRDVRVHWFSQADHDVHVQHPVELADVLHEWAVRSASAAGGTAPS